MIDQGFSKDNAGSVNASFGALIGGRADERQALIRTQALARTGAAMIAAAVIGVLIVISGLALWKPVQFSELANLFGSFQNIRLVHFLCMTAIVAFIVVHVTLALLVPQSLLAMLTGGPAIDNARDAAPSAAPIIAEIKTIPEVKTVPEIETSH